MLILLLAISTSFLIYVSTSFGGTVSPILENCSHLGNLIDPYYYPLPC